MRTINELMYIETLCPFCHKSHSIGVDFEDFLDWHSGVFAQVAFPYLSDEEREMVISGICPDCWNRVYALPDEEEDEGDDIDVCMRESLGGNWW